MAAPRTERLHHAIKVSESEVTFLRDYQNREPLYCVSGGNPPLGNHVAERIIIHTASLLLVGKGVPCRDRNVAARIGGIRKRPRGGHPGFDGLEQPAIEPAGEL